VKLAPVEVAQAPALSEAERELFELTPPELITEVVTEEGVHPTEDISALVDRTPFLRDGYALLQPANA
jgi:translation initiation factor 2B subunit (eIF-2B alpha/beta/delta family)